MSGKSAETEKGTAICAPMRQALHAGKRQKACLRHAIHKLLQGKRSVFAAQNNGFYRLFDHVSRPFSSDFNAQFTGGALFDVSLTGTYYNGYDDNTIWTQTFKEGANSPLYLVENAYSIDNPDGTFPRITLGSPGHGGDNGLASTFWLRDGKYIRLKSAQLGYSFPRQWMQKINIQNLRIFVEGSNLFTISGLPEGIDPESPGVNNGYYPQQRTIMGGISLTF